MTSRAHVVAVGQALLVTVLWSTSWVLIKIGLDELELEPLTFAGLRYTLAALLLAPLALGPARRARLHADRRLLTSIAALGLVLYAVTQGAQFAALELLPAAAVSLVLTATPVLVALLSGRLLDERATPIQLLGIGALLGGAFLYFGAVDLGAQARLGLAVAGVGLAANALSALLGRSLVRDAAAAIGGVLPLTAASMGLGGLTLLVVGLAVEGVPPLGGRALLVLAWLAVVNTAFAFTLWNHTLRVLTAVESSVLNNTMLIQIALLAWIFLGESLGPRELAGIALAAAGVLAVELARVRRRPAPALADPVPADAGAGTVARR